MTVLTPHSSPRKPLKAVVIVLVGFGLGWWAATTYLVRQQILGDGNKVEITKVINLYGRTRSEQVSFDQYWDIWKKIKAKHVGQQADDVKLFYGSIQGMVNGLGDPYSMYFPPAQAEEFAKELSGEFEGVGMEVGMKKDQLIVTAPIPGSPAEKAGIRPQDAILAIDGKDTSGMSLTDAVTKIRGPKGSTVKLSILPVGAKEIKELTIQRAAITIPSVTWKQKDNGIAYIRLGYFNDKTASEFDSVVRDIKRTLTQPRGIVLDLRSNPGGLLDQSVYVASAWMGDKVVVRERSADNNTRDIHGTGPVVFAQVPTVVLVDEGSASAAEILAGALQDYKMAQLFGKKTFGKGSVQEVEPFPDGSALKLTVATWLTPNNREINGKGIEPDQTIDKMFIAPTDSTSTEGATDEGLNQALKFLQK